eukprot:4660313-Karenia_brevis.AAC.1
MVACHDEQLAFNQLSGQRANVTKSHVSGTTCAKIFSDATSIGKIPVMKELGVDFNVTKLRQYPVASKKAEETLRRLHKLQVLRPPKSLRNIFISNGCLACTSHAAWITPIPSQYE